MFHLLLLSAHVKVYLLQNLLEGFVVDFGVFDCLVDRLLDFGVVDGKIHLWDED